MIENNKPISLKPQCSMESAQVSHHYPHHTLIQNSCFHDLTDYIEVLFLFIQFLLYVTMMIIFTVNAHHTFKVLTCAYNDFCATFGCS